MSIFTIKRKTFSKEEKENKNSKYGKEAAIGFGTGAGLMAGTEYVLDTKADRKLKKALLKEGKAEKIDLSKFSKREMKRIVNKHDNPNFLKRHGGKVALAAAGGAILGATRDARKPIKVFKKKED